MRHELNDSYQPSSGLCVLLVHGRVFEMGECQDMLVWKLWVKVPPKPSLSLYWKPLAVNSLPWRRLFVKLVAKYYVLPRTLDSLAL